MTKSEIGGEGLWSGDVSDRASFLAYLAYIRSELSKPVREIDWENESLADFLEAMAAWVADTEGGFVNSNPWLHAAQLIEAATGYE